MQLSLRERGVSGGAVTAPRCTAARGPCPNAAARRDEAATAGDKTAAKIRAARRLAAAFKTRAASQAGKVCG